MPRRAGIRDDDTLGRFADIETRLDLLEGAIKDRSQAVPERDERRDTEPRNRQMMVEEGDREPLPAQPDPMAGATQDDNTRLVDADDRDRAEARARKAAADEEKAPSGKKK